MSGLLQAIGFLTVVPVPRHFRRRVSAAMIVYFPLVGLLAGSVAAAADAALVGLELPLRSILVLGVWLLMTGALHLDGWIDTCDAMAPGLTRDTARRALRDPGAGAMGVVGAVLLIGTKWAALTAVAVDRALWIVAAAAVSRWATAIVVVAFSNADSRPGLGSRVRRGATVRHALASSLFVLLLLVGMSPVTLAAALAAAVAAAGFVAVVARHRLGELPGDAYGAGLELAETVVLVLAAAGASP